MATLRQLLKFQSNFYIFTEIERKNIYRYGTLLKFNSLFKTQNYLLNLSKQYGIFLFKFVLKDIFWSRAGAGSRLDRLHNTACRLSFFKIYFWWLGSGQVCKRKYILKDHVTSLHMSDGGHECGLCGKVYKTRNSLQNHVCTYHKPLAVSWWLWIPVSRWRCLLRNIWIVTVAGDAEWTIEYRYR